MKNAIASNAIVSCAAAMSDMAADYEQQVALLQQSVGALGQQVKQSNDDRVKVTMLVGMMRDVVRDFVFERLTTEETQRRFFALVEQMPWPIPNPTEPISRPGGKNGDLTSPVTSSASIPSE